LPGSTASDKEKLKVKDARQITEATPSELILDYGQPARAWVEALPLGNGRLGAMVFGGVTTERLQFNLDTLLAKTML
jgi:alpha-L-fucosidase 2